MKSYPLFITLAALNLIGSVAAAPSDNNSAVLAPPINVVSPQNRRPFSSEQNDKIVQKFLALFASDFSLSEDQVRNIIPAATKFRLALRELQPRDRKDVPVSAKADWPQLLKQKQALFDALVNEIQPFVTAEQLANIQQNRLPLCNEQKDKIVQKFLALFASDFSLSADQVRNITPAATKFRFALRELRLLDRKDVMPVSAKADGTQLLKQKQALFDAFFNEIQPFVTTEQLANIRTDYDSAIAKAKDRIQQGLPRR